ncbi:DUF6683 family protein [Devosia sp.]|uniref:DUF6683 family protein n=1 Tax=Devosia sp. TaxID=1871048 RepID=UPI001ACB722D|nr:DUF6683 family protein [Devosia sp.]MBN9333442.1 hypothetical protein [Devosia sp.]
MNRFFRLLAVLLVLPSLAMAQESAAPAAASYDTSYPPSTVISARIQRQFLDTIRWSVSAQARDSLAAAFAERPALEIWQDLVAGDGLKTGNVADAITAYWVLNWVTANARYNLKVDNRPIQAQMQDAMARDPNFRSLSNLQKQEMAEGYILKFLVEHAALNDAMSRKDVAALGKLALGSATRFQREMGVNLLALEPGPGGLQPKAQPPASPAAD